jgi:hypothetical protein
MPDDAAKGFGRSASLDTAGAEGAKPCATAASHKHIAAPQRLLYYSYISHITSLQRGGLDIRIRDETGFGSFTERPCKYR